MTIFPLTIFPEGGLASSVITTVWVGVFVLCFFNLRYGWVLSGLVVPGYLVPLLIVKPLAAAVILVEAVLTYVIVWLFSEKIAKGRFPSLFGRDRFMGLILASIAVRLTMDGYLLPELATWLEENFDRRMDWHSNLQSFGLVIISLLANQFWKPGLSRGLVATFVTVGLTWLIIRYGLMELTNFRISGVSYLYEGLASSILASPKAYIILTLTAMIASQMNVRYGWDFSGILIPALIALQWYQPTKIVTSLLEAVVIYFLARLILKLPMMANVTLEGGRKLLLFFNISFAWKMAVGWFVVWQNLEVKTTDFFGFGYLLSTLIAIKAHDKDIFPRLARSTLQVSLIGAALGNIVGFSLSAATNRVLEATADETGSSSGKATPRLNALMVQAIGDAHVRAIRAEAHPLTEESATALGDLVALLEANELPTTGSVDLVSDDWHVQRIEGGRLAISRADGLGHELLVFNPSALRELSVVVPDPTLARGLGPAALVLQSNQQARWLVLASPAPPATTALLNVIDVFAAASAYPQLTVSAKGTGGPSFVEFANRAPSSMDIAGLRSVVPNLQVEMRSATIGQGEHRAIVFLNELARISLARQLAPPQIADPARCRLSRLRNMQPAWTELEQLAYLRNEIADEYIQAVPSGKEPALARAAARLGGFEIERCILGGRAHWSLQSPQRSEIQMYLAEGETPRRTIITYRDEGNTLPSRLGAAMHSSWQSQALLISPQVDSYLRSSKTSFDVMWQELVRNQEDLEDRVVFQFRRRPTLPPGFQSNADVILAGDRIGETDLDLNPFLSVLREAGLRADAADGSKHYAGFEARPGMALHYLEQAAEQRFVVGYVLPAEGGAQ